jgi:hypothetical protein
MSCSSIPSSTETRSVQSEGTPSGLIVTRLAESIADQQLAVRSDFLNARRPRLDYVFRVRQDMGGARKSRPWHMLLSLSFCDLDEGAPASAVAECYEKVAALIRARGREIQHDGVSAPSILPLILRENRHEFSENQAEDHVIANERNPDAIRGLLAASLKEREAMDRRDAVLTQRLAELDLEAAAR